MNRSRTTPHCFSCRPLPIYEAQFLSELGPVAVHLCLDVYRSRFELQNADDYGQVCSVDSESLPNGEQIRFIRHSFLQDFLLMHLGIPSRRFQWCSVASDTDSFHYDVRAILSGQFTYTFDRMDSLTLGCSEVALTSLLKRHLIAGTYYRQLDWFTRRTQWISVNVRGPSTVGLCSAHTWACLCDAVSTCLVAYEEGIQLLLESERATWSDAVKKNNRVAEQGPLNFSNKLKVFTNRIE